jgi:hypothetical protein
MKSPYRGVLKQVSPGLAVGIADVRAAPPSTCCFASMTHCPSFARDPWISQRWDEEYRFRRVPRFPYIVYFRIIGMRVFVVAIIHERRKPGRWMPK